ncbi:MAG: formimidoylglutamate deiminase [Actinomycetota bacterium]|nr:formimidoylglutamate deiminase [Actinomycetota bacterium]
MASESGLYWCETAWLGSALATPHVLVQVEAGAITGVLSGVECPAKATRLAGLTLPGLANAHSHAFHRALRGRTQVGNGSFWTWREQMYGLCERLDPDSYFRLARAVYGEMAMAGITCVGEFHYLHHGAGGTPYADPNAMSAALVAAAEEAGLRITLLDACYLHGGIGQVLNAQQRRFSDGDALAWAVRASEAVEALSGPAVRVGAAIHSVRAVDPAGIEVVAEWAERHDAPLHAHVSEQPAENDRCIEVYGVTPTALLAERGVLRRQFTAVHATHLAGADIGLYGAAGSTICLCPTTERDLADGIGPAWALRDAGAHLALGTDSNAIVDMFEEARAVELDQRLASQVRGLHDSVSLLRAATVQGHASLGWPEAGRIEVGAPADLVSVRMDTVRTAGASAHTLLETAVFAAGAADVHHVVAGGRVVVSDGRHCSIDVAAELGAVIGELVEGFS